MKKQFIRTRRVRYGGITVVLTLLVITVTVLLNACFSTLATRYKWYTDLNAKVTYEVSDACYTLLDELFAAEPNKQVEIIFCNTEKGVKADSELSYVYETASSLAARYPNRLTLHCYDTVTNPEKVRKYATTSNLTTGETEAIAIYTTSVIVVSEEYHRVYSLEEFFVFEDGDASKAWAYNGEKKLASGILRALDGDLPTVCLTNNHGEVLYDYELLYLLDDAGYSITHIDLYRDEIPTNCDLLISYNPNTDLIDDELSERSEIDILNEFLAEEGKTFLVLVENGTPALPNYERFLADWGFAFRYHTDASNGNSYRYMVQNDSQSLTSDGYTIYGEAADGERADSFLNELPRKVVFQNATAMAAANGFVNNGNGSYTKGNRTLYRLFESGEGAVSWAHGTPVSSENVMLMGVTEQTGEAGSSRVGVISSVRFFTEDFLQSAVYGNTDVALRLFESFGKEAVPKGLTIKPFLSQDISTITTAEMVRWTVALAVTPVILFGAAAVVVLVKRHRA